MGLEVPEKILAIKWLMIMGFYCKTCIRFADEVSVLAFTGGPMKFAVILALALGLVSITSYAEEKYPRAEVLAQFKGPEAKAVYKVLEVQPIETVDAFGKTQFKTKAKEIEKSETVHSKYPNCVIRSATNLTCVEEAKGDISCGTIKYFTQYCEDHR
jgi:hypothetical protein